MFNSINWKVRVQSKEWWIGLISAFVVASQVITQPFGISFDFAGWGDYAISVVNVLAVLGVAIGVTNDPTTAGLHDSCRALGYDKLSDDHTCVENAVGVVVDDSDVN